MLKIISCSVGLLDGLMRKVLWLLPFIVISFCGISGVGVNSLVYAQNNTNQSLSSSSESIGVVTKIKNNVKASSIFGTTRSLAVNTLVYQGDLIETDEQSELVIVFNDNTNIVIGRNSSVSLDRVFFDRYSNRGNFISRIIRGSLIFVSGMIAKNDRNDMRFITSLGNLSIRGTKGYVRVEADGSRAEFWLLNPEIDIETAVVARNRSSTTVLSQPNTKVIALAGERLSEPESADVRELSGKFEILPNAAQTSFAEPSHVEAGFIKTMWILLKQRMFSQ